MQSASGAVAAMSATGQSPSLARVLFKYAVMSVVLALIFFMVSGHADWTRAWTYIALTLGTQMVVGAVLHRMSPDLLVERSKMREGTKAWDKVLAPIVAFVGPLAVWITCSVDVRYHWPPAVPIEWSAAALALCGLGSVWTAWAMLTNRFFSATVRIQEDRGHVVVDSGPYAWIRHPGYTGAIAFTLASPVALGSWWGVVPAAVTVVVLAVRTALEDRTLQSELPGYADYARRTPFRLIPGVW